MTEIGPEHPISYRQELVAPIFRKLQASESCAVIGAASMGKSRLIHFLLRPDVQSHYLQSTQATTLLACVDCNRMVGFTTWALHELILTALVEGCGEHAVLAEQRTKFSQLRDRTILSQNELLAQRNVELALRMLCKEQGWQVCLLLDEFDAAYQTLPAQALASLRALRDMNKYQLSYLLFLRNPPLQLRGQDGSEGFYELFSRSLLGLQPYTAEDGERVIMQILTRRRHELPDINQSVVSEVLRLSGSHPGLLVALLDALIKGGPYGESWPTWAMRQPMIEEECRKLWEGLRSEERQALYQVANEMEPAFNERETLLLKGLLKRGPGQALRFFSPLLQHYAASRAPKVNSGLHVDIQAGNVWVNGEQCSSMTLKEFDLLKYLYTRQNEICDTDQIIQQLYPGDEAFDINENTIAALVRRVRSKIEPDSKRPQFLLNVKGRGYRLNPTP